MYKMLLIGILVLPAGCQGLKDPPGEPAKIKRLNDCTREAGSTCRQHVVELESGSDRSILSAQSSRISIGRQQSPGGTSERRRGRAGRRGFQTGRGRGLRVV